MKPNRFRQVLSEGRMPVGHMISEFATRGVAKILEAAGVDFVFIDMEHTAIDPARVADLMAWFKATPIAPFVRVPQGLYHFIARTLDAGALGVMVANVETADQAREIVNAAKYAPLGGRGVGLGLAHTDYRNPEPAIYFHEANENTTVICMIESCRGLANVDAIASTDGVDMLWVGHFDLTQSMGIPGQFHETRFVKALRTVAEAARSYSKPVGIQPASLEQAKQWHELGVDVFSWGNDVAVYSAALTAGVSSLRSELGTRTRGGSGAAN
jgi:2-dehydro-3-deoxyglucarate aldolase/4-hydroxy-2-oxoheptanedioate aldolase